MTPKKSHLHLTCSFLLACLLLLLGAPAAAQDDDIQIIPTPPAGAAPPAPAAPAARAAPAAPPGAIEIRGMHCTPDVKEVETRRPIPIHCTVDYPVAGVELRYRYQESGAHWEKIVLEQTDNGYSGSIPCGVTSKRGNLAFYLFARNDANKVVARIGRHQAPLVVHVVEHTDEQPPSLPGQPAPQRCYEQNECPPDLLGTATCPGTHAPKVVKKAWGGSCGDTSECQSGLECIKGSCDTPTKCDTEKDCAEGGECVDGMCHFPTAEELKTRLGPAKHHWIGLHAGVDFYLMRSATGVCGNTTSDSKDFACFDGGNEYAGTPNGLYAGTIKSSVYLATVRALLSYDYAFKRLLVGGRIGWAFRGAPKGFSPFHIEAHALYSLRPKPFDLHFRPYLGLTLGHAQVDASGQTTIVDCSSGDAAELDACRNAKTQAEFVNAFNSNPPVASKRTLTAYRSGGGFFFGPVVELWFMLSNEAAVVASLTALLPDVTFEPTVAYQMGL